MLDLVMGAAAPAMSGRAPTRHGPLAETKGLVFEAGGKRLIDNVDLRLSAGPITMIMGPSGAGKSVLLRLLHGLDQPAVGAVLWGGMPLTEEVRKRQAMVFQRPVLLRRSVAANLDFVRNLRGTARSDRREELLGRVGLSGLGRRPARSLSVGEQQRLALARALLLEPEVLFLDEPTASLDPASVLTIEEIVREERERGTKIVFVSHDLSQARRLADEVVFIHRGRVLEHAPAEAFFAGPRSAAARDYLAGRIVL
jgi:tungstate transport system ATP-binding protein